MLTLNRIHKIKAGQFIGLTYSNNVKMLKKDRVTGLPNPLDGHHVYKVVKQTVQGGNINYTNKMRNNQIRAGVAPTFTAQPSGNAEYLDANGQPTAKKTSVIRYKTTGNTTLRVYPFKGGFRHVTYFVDGKFATPTQVDTIKQHLASGGNRPACLNVSLTNIQEIRTQKETIKS